MTTYCGADKTVAGVFKTVWLQTFYGFQTFTLRLLCLSAVLSVIYTQKTHRQLPGWVAQALLHIKLPLSLATPPRHNFSANYVGQAKELSRRISESLKKNK